MFDSLYRDEATQVLNDRIRRPELTPSIPEPGAFSGFWGAVKKTIPAAGLETTRAVSAAFGEAAQGLGAPDSDMMQLIAPETYDRIKESTDTQELDKYLSRDIKKFTPDPQATGWAGQIVHQAGKVIIKAGAYGTLGGIPGAVGGTAVDEGINETLRLTDQGVDLETARKVGAVHGVATGLGIIAPVAGKTVAQTVGAVVAGGPGLFMAETQAAKTILKNADYNDIARQYNPLDPVGLIASAALPAAMGAASHAMRVRSTPEQIAAAQTVIAADHVDSTALVPPENIAGMNSHVDAFNEIKNQIDFDEPVVVPDYVQTDPVKLAEVEKQLRPAQKEIDRIAREETPPDPVPLKEEPETQSTKPVAEVQELPEVRAAKEILLRGRDFTITTEEGDLPISRLLEQADVDYKQANTDSKAFDVAVNCFLRGG